MFHKQTTIYMNDLLLTPDASGKTPLVNFKATGELTIEGRSIIENAVEFYNPALEWVRNLNDYCPQNIELTIKLEYFNTRSSKVILSMLKTLENLYACGKARVLVKWIYNEDDRDMHDAGHDYQTLIRVPFKMIELVEN
jgi:hypothetical protein